MKKIFLTYLVLVSILSISSNVYALPTNAQDPKSPDFQILPCDGVGLNGGVPCDYKAAVSGFNTIVKFIIVMSIPIGTVMFAYAGFLYMRAGDNPGNKEKAKKLFLNILIGFGLVLGAWLIVYTVVSKLTTIDGGTVGNTGKTVEEITQLKDAPNPNK